MYALKTSRAAIVYVVLDESLFLQSFFFFFFFFYFENVCLTVNFTLLGVVILLNFLTVRFKNPVNFLTFYT